MASNDTVEKSPAEFALEGLGFKRGDSGRSGQVTLKINVYGPDSNDPVIREEDWAFPESWGPKRNNVEQQLGLWGSVLHFTCPNEISRIEICEG